MKLATAGAATIACAAAPASAPAAPIGAYTTHGAYTFASAPNLHPPKLSTDVATQTRKLAPGDFLVANFPNLTLTEPAHGAGIKLVGQSGPLILDTRLQPVWFDPVPTDVVAMDLKQQQYQGKPVLTWWQGVLTSSGAPTSGQVEVVDQHYRTIATITGQDGWTISEHEAVISGADVWVTAYKFVPINLSAYGGLADGILYDAAVQEYDLRTGKLVSTWDANAHIPLSQSKQPPSAKPGPTGAAIPWDAYHVNSIQVTGSGTFLVSMRNEWAAYLVDIKTGKIEWTLSANAKISTFKLPAAGAFEWQHDVELHPGNVVSIFDDACCELEPSLQFGTPSGPARGLVLKLDIATHTASFVAQYVLNPNLHTAFLGNTQLLGDGNVAIGWGSQPFFSEFSKSGKLLLDARWPLPDLSYRAYVDQWVGKPVTAPSGAAHVAHDKAIVYASWNGATQVSAWRVLAGANPSKLKLVATKARSGFETAIALLGTFKSFKVQAVNAKRKVIGTSKGF
jgi:hypothetical protein